MLDIQLTYQRAHFTLAIDAQFSEGVTGILGPSGCGKSTLLALIAGLLNPQQGRIVLNKKTLVDTQAAINIPCHARRVGLVFQDGQLFPHFTVQKNLTYGWKGLTPEQRHFSLEQIVQLLELDKLLQRLPKDLSGGEQQRVALGRAILYSPDLLLLDEPLSALDARLKSQIIQFLQRIKTELAIPMLYVTHDERELVQLADSQWVIDEGQLIPHSG